MKTISILAFLIFAGCNATTSPNGSTTTEGGMTATVNSQAWSSTGVPGVNGGTTALINTPTAGAITITGVSVSLAGNQIIAIALAKPHLGPDSLGGLSLNRGTFSYGTPGQSSYVSLSGSVNLSKYDTVNHKVTGTFNFVGQQLDTLSHQITVTNGSFLDVSW